VKINGTTSGSVTLAAPASGSDVTLTLPGSAGTVAVVGSAAMTLITSGTLSGASVLLSNIPATYKDLRLVVRNFLPATDAQNLEARVNNDSTANRHYYAATVNSDNNAFSATTIRLSPDNDNSATQSSIVATFYDYANTATWKMVVSDGVTNNATTTTSVNIRRFIGIYNQTAAISSLALLPTSGNFTSGDYLLYGIG